MTPGQKILAGRGRIEVLMNMVSTVYGNTQ